MTRLLPAATLLLALAASACGPAPEDPARRVKVQSGTDATTPDAPSRGGTVAATSEPTPGDRATRYACDDGSTAVIDRQAAQARIELPDGRSVALPMAQSASKGGGDVFVGETMSLQHEGASATLFLAGGQRSVCQALDAAEPLLQSSGAR